jgi:hypothetical protein
MVFATILNLSLVPVLYVVIERLKERFARRRSTTEHLEAQPVIRRAADGHVILSFPNGGKPVELSVAASLHSPDE